MIRQSASTDADLACEPVPSCLELASLREEYPGFRVWQEVSGDRVRYVACRLAPGIGPHTVVTADLGELRAMLDDALVRPQAVTGQPLDRGAPNIARMYDRWLGGKDNFAADRHAADTVSGGVPRNRSARHGLTVIRHPRRDTRRRPRDQPVHRHRRRTTHLTEPSTRSPSRPTQPPGWPTSTTTRLSSPTPARSWRAGPGVAVIAGDLRQPAAILTRPELRDLIDLGQPVCVILAAVLHFLSPSEADKVVATFRQAMAPGSYLIASSGTSTGTSPVLIDRLAAAYQNTATVTGRTVEEIAGYFTGLQLVPPGLADVWAWRPGTQRRWPPPRTARILGAVARQAATTATITAHHHPGKSVTV